jgi:hypothetical protein
MERGKENEEALPGSLQSLRGEYEGIREIGRTRRTDMPQAQVTMDVRKVNDKVSIIDVKGELTAFAESVLMQAYTQASDGRVRAIVLNFEGPWSRCSSASTARSRGSSPTASPSTTGTSSRSRA